MTYLFRRLFPGAEVPDYPLEPPRDVLPYTGTIHAIDLHSEEDTPRVPPRRVQALCRELREGRCEVGLCCGEGEGV